MQAKMLNPSEILTAQPNATRVLDEPTGPAGTQEMIDHTRLIGNRPRQLNRDMMDYIALGVSPGKYNLSFEEGIAEIGTFTYFSLRRARATAVSGETPAIALVLSGYKARVLDGRVVLGGEIGNICAYDLRFRPFEGTSRSGKIIDSRNVSTIRLGLMLDEAVEKVVKRVSSPDAVLQLPRFWAGFRPQVPPVVEDCPAVRRAAMQAVRPGYSGSVLPSLRSPGGTVSGVFLEAEGGIGILFDEGLPTESSVMLPRTAVLRAFVREGVEIEAGTALADFVPRRVYPNMAMIAQLFGDDIADWLMRDVSAANDQVIEGLICRRVELCPVQMSEAVKVYEDVRHLMGPDGVVMPQVARSGENDRALRPEKDDVLYVDLSALRPAWVHKFQPARR